MPVLDIIPTVTGGRGVHGDPEQGLRLGMVKGHPGGWGNWDFARFSCRYYNIIKLWCALALGEGRHCSYSSLKTRLQRFREAIC